MNKKILDRFYCSIDFDFELNLHEKIELLKYIQQLENIRKEAIDYCMNNMQLDENIDDYWVTTNDLLNILNKGCDFNV